MVASKWAAALAMWRVGRIVGGVVAMAAVHGCGEERGETRWRVDGDMPEASVVGSEAF